MMRKQPSHGAEDLFGETHRLLHYLAALDRAGKLDPLLQSTK